MMMIALPALQRQQRDTARKEDIDSLGIKNTDAIILNMSSFRMGLTVGLSSSIFSILAATSTLVPKSPD